MHKSDSFVLPESFLEEAHKRPLSFTAKDGSVKVLPFVGGSSGPSGETEGAGTDSGESEEVPGKEEADKEGEDDEGTDGDEDGEDSDSNVPDNVKEILRKNRREARKFKAEAEAARREAAAAKLKAKEYEDRDKSELEKATDRAETAEKRLAEVLETNKVLALRTAFLADSSVAWVDADDAVEMALSKYGLRDLSVSDTGTVDKKALKAIVKAMSQEKAYLVKQEDQGKQGPSGGSFNGGKGGKGAEANEAALLRKYPAMRGRQKTT